MHSSGWSGSVTDRQILRRILLHDDGLLTRLPLRSIQPELKSNGATSLTAAEDITVKTFSHPTLILRSLLALTLVTAATVAKADTAFTFTFDGGGSSQFGDITGTGTFYGQEIGNTGTYQIVNNPLETGSFTFTNGGSPATENYTVGDLGFLFIGTGDNLVTSIGGGFYQVDISGLDFELSNGDELGFYFNNTSNPLQHGPSWDFSNGIDQDLGLATTEIINGPVPPVVTPEPGTLGLLGTGILGMAGLLRRRFLQSR